MLADPARSERGWPVGLARDGWDLALGYWTPYDDRIGYERTPEDPGRVAEQCQALGSNVVLLPGDLADVDVPDQLVTSAARELGPWALSAPTTSATPTC